MSAARFVIFNADDFGYSHGINRGILEAHERGVVTSTTLVVNGLASAAAAGLARRHPALAVGLHVNFTNEASGWFDLEDEGQCRAELQAQYRRCLELLGRKPTHLDSHQHVHRHPMRGALFEELAESEGLPLRYRPPVAYKGGFYGQWEYGVSDPSKVSLAALESILRHELAQGISELACHPGYYDPALAAVYHHEREDELRTLTDPRLPQVLLEAGLRLISYHELPEALRQLAADAH